MMLKLFKKRTNLALLMFAFVLSGFTAVQAQKTVTGTVLDETGTPLPGASVVVKGTTNGTSTDFDGKFSLNVSADATTLQVSFIGYTTKEVAIADNITVTLDPDNILDEVVVVGYGTVKKSDVVGSVASVDVEEAVAVPTTNVSEMLRGRAAGVQVNLNDARPGGNSNIVIRGKVSIEGNDPLIIVDGIPYDDINDVAASDITSVEVLKDASSQAIYGARAANGVILITTKRGKEGSFKIDYHGYLTSQKLTKNFDLYSGEEFAQVRREARRTDNNDEYEPDEDIFEPFELESLNNRTYVDWEDLVMENAVIQSHSLSVSGGGEKTKVFSSVNYFDQDGLIPSSGFKRGTFRLNVDQQVTKKLSLQANVNFQTSLQDIESNSLNFITISPLAKPFDENGELNKEPLGSGNTTINPLWNIRESTNEVRTNLTDINLVGLYQFTPNLSYKLNTFLRNRASEQGIYRSSKHGSGDGDVNGLATLSDKFYREFLLENIIDYAPEINENNKLDLTFVHSVNERKTNTNSIEKSNFANDDLGYNGVANNIGESFREIVRKRQVGFLGRARYSLMDKYLLTLTARTDGSSVFGAKEKWGFFPAIAFAWKMHEESFLEDSNSINQMKLRITYGQTGNDGIDSKETLGVSDYIPYVFGGVTSGGFAPLNRLPNPDLKWETTTSLNIGLDYGLFRNRVTGTFEFYKSTTTDLLLDRVLPGTTGFSVTRFNVGEVENTGFEAVVNTNIIRKQDFNWSVGLIFSTNKNEIISLTGEKDAEGNEIDLPGNDLYIGETLSTFTQFLFDGIWQEGDDIANSAQPDAMPGDVRIVDMNDDKILDNEDLYYFKSTPDWYGSINTTANFKGFELFADVFISQGAMRSNPYLASFENGGTLQGIRNGIKVPYYTPENPSNEFPRPRPTTPSNLFALAVKDASFVRLRTLTLGYNIPQSALSKIGFSNAKLYVTGTNLLTFTDYKSYSPENNPGDFPDSKGITVGVKLGL
ncbi:TonB-dependent receptor [Aureibaculum sp. 2210JD6-5]|uniref:SusC/RagA family TonB-linked outer membrane protein n=1 Tax=Aureibaculum sp. 2210JD6-5 TaxID=3103957 RepID=UPI002AAD3219|nr:TonB-dependent receptor [Aureibaculum sp. 2210JD6-5]MDY7394707.1 TonB-dependent receptor [Aureibaculum sp. 2210JD6-5]